jgi:flagellar protein FliS
MWKDVYLENRVLTADPLELVHILYEHTLTMVQDARQHLAAGDIPGRGKAISRALAAVEELDGSLDRHAGGSLSRNLAGLYQYMRLRLLTANIQQQDAPLAEVEKLLRTLDEAWSAIGPGAQTAVTETVPAGQTFGNAFGLEPQMEYAAQGWSA